MLKQSECRALRAKWRLLRSIDKNFLHSGFLYDYKIIKRLTRILINKNGSAV